MLDLSKGNSRMSNYAKFADENLSTRQDAPMTVIVSSTVQKPIFERFICFSLKTGALIIAYFHVIICALGIPGFAVLMGKAVNHAKNDDEVLLINVFFGTMLAVLSLILIASLLLLLGIYKKKPAILTTFMIIYGVLVSLNVLGYIRTMSRGIISAQLVTQMLFSLLLGVVSLLTVHSYRTQVRNERQQALSGNYAPNDDPPPYNEAA